MTASNACRKAKVKGVVHDARLKKACGFPDTSPSQSGPRPKQATVTPEKTGKRSSCGEDVSRGSGAKKRLRKGRIEKEEVEEDIAGEPYLYDLFGPKPRVRLYEQRCVCPRGLLPRSMALLPSRKLPRPLAPRARGGALMAEAAARGLSATEAPAFLGVLPPELAAEGGERCSWRVLLVVGPSGSGKTSLLRSLAARLHPASADAPLYPTAAWVKGRAVVDHFEGGFEEAQSWLCAVGLSSVPTWCKPFEVLSTGEQYRANVARTMAVGCAGRGAPLIFDEWTSELDRGVSRSVCVSLKRRMDARRRAGHKDPPLLFATCHEDVEAYLRPDALVTCQAGLRPRLEYHSAAAEASMGESTPGLRAIICGLPEPLPPAGMLMGNWFAEDLSAAFYIRLNSGRLSYKPVGAGKSGEVVLRVLDECNEPASSPCWQSHVWLGGTSPALELEVRLRLVDQSRLLLQSRPSPNTLAVAKRAGAWRGLMDALGALSGEETRGTKGESEKVYRRKLRSRLTTITQLMKVSREEEHVLGKLPADRLKWQAAVVSKLLKRATKQKTQCEDQLRELEASSEPWSPECTATRMPSLGCTCFPWLRDGQGKVELTQVDHARGDYGGFDVDRLQAVGWYVREDALGVMPYPGLEPLGMRRFAPVFRLNPRNEAQTAGLLHLASFVGEEDGSLSPAVEEAGRLLDKGFFGLCVHVVPCIEGPADIQQDTQNEENESRERLDVQHCLRDFSVGVILGSSGSGKSTLATEHFGVPLKVGWLETSPALAHFESLEEAKPALAAAALDIEVALRPVGLLSAGERERVALARGLAEWAAGRQQALVVEEFTSLVDRPIARLIARGVAEFARERPELRGLVILSCHADVVGGGLLEPDWIFECGPARLLVFPRESASPQTGAVSITDETLKFLEATLGRKVAEDYGFTKGGRTDREEEGMREGFPRQEVHARCAEGCNLSDPRGPLRQPLRISSMELVVRRALPAEWRNFREHHYKDHSLNSSSVCFVGSLEGRAVAFCAVIPTGFTLNWVVAQDHEGEATRQAKRYGYPLEWGIWPLLREHRTVVLPDSQGLGLGSLLADAVARLSTEMGYSFMSTTAHPTYGGYRDRSPFWAALDSSKRERPNCACATFSHVWIGAAQNDGGVDQDRLGRLSKRVVITASCAGNVQSIGA